MGGIGRNVLSKAKSFGMIPQYHNRKPLPEELSGGAKYVSFDELLSTSDVISLHIPLNVSSKILQFPTTFDAVTEEHIPPHLDG